MQAAKFGQITKISKRFLVINKWRIFNSHNILTPCCTAWSRNNIFSQNFDFKIRRDHRFSNERRVYESVDSKSPSWDTSKKIDGKQNSCSKRYVFQLLKKSNERCVYESVDYINPHLGTHLKISTENRIHAAKDIFSNYQTHPVNFLHWLRVIFWLISNFCRHHPPPPSPHLGCGGRSGGKCDSTFKVKMTQFFLCEGGGGCWPVICCLQCCRWDQTGCCPGTERRCVALPAAPLKNAHTWSPTTIKWVQFAHQKK